MFNFRKLKTLITLAELAHANGLDPPWILVDTVIEAAVLLTK